MYKKILFSLLLTSCTFFNAFAERGDYVADTLKASHSLALIEFVYGEVAPLIEEEYGNDCVVWDLAANYGVELYKLVYETVNTYGEPTFASGLVGVPIDNDCNMPIINYNHGTSNGGVLSEPGTIADLLEGDIGEWFLSLPVSSGGAISVLPDYIGYGQSKCTDFHGYNHYSSLATDVVDMIRATKQFCEMNGWGLSDELFITGYSEGGYTAMAVTKEIQENHCDEMQVTASAPLSGAYNIYPLTRDTLLSPSYNNISNLTYFVYAYNNICPEILEGDDLSEAVLAPYADMIPVNWNECNPNGDFSGYPDTAALILDSEYVASVTGDPCHPFNELLRRNNLNNWVPKMPMRLYYTRADEQVPYTNAPSTAAWMAAQGANVEALTLCGSTLTHTPFAIPSLIHAQHWFETFVSGECDYVADLEDYACEEAPAAAALCPEELVYTPYLDFEVSEDLSNITWEERVDSVCLGITGLTTNQINNIDVILAQNPVTDYVNIQITNPYPTDAKIYIYDLTGKTFVSETISLKETNNYNKNISDLTNGVYLIQLQLSDGSNKTLRFLKK